MHSALRTSGLSKLQGPSRTGSVPGQTGGRRVMILVLNKRRKRAGGPRGAGRSQCPDSQASPMARAKRLSTGTGWSCSRSSTCTREQQPDPVTEMSPCGAGWRAVFARAGRSSDRVILTASQQQQHSAAAWVRTAISGGVTIVSVEPQKQQPNGQPAPNRTSLLRSMASMSRVSSVMLEPQALTLSKSGKM
mmetsp:Transcript_10935/g.36259  ORF Transcript_10935/g.36259 Transcript_10935/m.36259 type:complete len:191 (+) Transcript_10935:58-630(+)